MKKFTKTLVTLLCAALLATPILTACGEREDADSDELVDYASQLHLDLTSETKKQEVTVRLYIDGDTTHFNPVANSTVTADNSAYFKEKTNGYIKARYLAIDTPESTMRIQKWGKKASDFTYNKLKSATSIVVESDDANWNIDSTGERYMLWVWYKTAEMTEYRNLNVEILQEGLAIASSTSNNRYGTIAMAALNQAQAHKLYVFAPASVKDPDFFDGAAIETTLKDIRCHPEEFLNKAVRFEAVVASVFAGNAYVEAYDEETGLYFGIPIFYGSETGDILNYLSPGNKLSVRGSFQMFDPDKDGVGTYQVADVSYDRFHKDAETNTKLLAEDQEISYKVTEAAKFASTATETILFDWGDETETVTLPYAQACMGTSVTVEHLHVTGGYTTQQGDSENALTLDCEVNGATMTVRFAFALKDAEGNLVTLNRMKGKTITVKGVIDEYNGTYQVKVADFANITFES